MTDEFIVDLTEYKDRVGSRVPPGDYDVVVEDTENDKSKAGNPMVNMWLRVIDGPEKGATIIDRLVMTENALFRVVGFLDAVGIPTPKKKFKVPHKAIRGRRLTVTVEDGDPYNGRVKSEIRAYMKYKGTAVEEEATDLGDLDAVTAEPEWPAEESSTNGNGSTPAAEAAPVEEIDLAEVEL